MTARTYRSLLLAAASTCLLVLTGCTTGGSTIQVGNPDLALKAVLAAHEIKRVEDINCHRKSAESLDCRKLERDLEQLHMRFPYDDWILMLNAVVNYELGKNMDSQLMLDQLLVQPGATPNAAVLRSRIALQEGNVNLARTNLEKALREHPAHAVLYESLAATYYLEGRYDKALFSLQSADRLGAPPGRTSYHLALIHEARQEWALACRHFATVGEQEASYPYALARLLALSNEQECRAYR